MCIRDRATRPGVLRGAVLNDIGPVIEQIGLIRIRNYVGKTPLPHSWDEAVVIAVSYTHLDGYKRQEYLLDCRRDDPILLPATYR